jgi:hypothetical protein
MRPDLPKKGRMTFLYGDSSPSVLQVNFIEFLRDALDCSVQLLLADGRMTEGRGAGRAREAEADKSIDSVQQLAAAVAVTFKTLASASPDSPRGRCMAAILDSVDSLVKAEVANVRTGLAGAISQLEAQAARERQACTEALQTLLLKHDLPESAISQQLAVVGGTRYSGRVQMVTPFGFEAMLELEIPSDSLFAQMVRVERVVDRLEVQAPEVGGWLHKEVKVRGQRLEKLFVTELSLAGSARTLKLRTEPGGAGPGFDFVFRPENPRVTLTRVEEKSAGGHVPFEVAEGDAARLGAFVDKLAVAAGQLNRHRKSLLSATFEGEPIGAADGLRQLVERVIATIAPVVQEIASRSRSPGELVLRRLIGDDRREEIFVAKVDLKAKLEPLPPERRSLFDALWLDVPSMAVTRPVSRPNPLPLTSRRIPTPPMGSPLPGPSVSDSELVSLTPEPEPEDTEPDTDLRETYGTHRA